MKLKHERVLPLAHVLVDWQLAHGRQALPWQHTGCAYRVWLSEVMLQQTQVTTVLGYYERFLRAFPTVHDLAQADEEDVMRLWAGLGYYSRARNLHACAKQVVERFGGVFPKKVVDLESLPGIGRSTAGAIASLAYGVAAPILDGNVKRVYCRYFAVQGYPEQSAVKRQLWDIADRELNTEQPGAYNQALMDLGATVCKPKKPLCGQCPLKKGCVAFQQGLVDELPSSKPKKAKPNRFFVAVVLRNAQGHIGLVQQPAKGLWARLWMMPCVELSNEHDLVTVKALKAKLLEQGFVLSENGHAVLQRQCATLLSRSWLVHELTHQRLHFRCVVLQDEAVEGTFFAKEEKAFPTVVGKILCLFNRGGY